MAAMSNDRCDQVADAAQAAGGHAVFETAIGHCGIAWARGALVGVLLPEDGEEATRARMRRLHSDLPVGGSDHAPAFVRRAIERIAAMLRGAPDDLRDLPLDLTGVPAFHRRVYALVRDIPPGHTLTYGEVAARLGDPTAARAVGQALGRNPFAPVIPCHRVLASGGRAGGFSAGGGIDTKLRMLQAEGARMSREPGLFDGDPAVYR
jgi:methylated-DNA-[protein]-cysteine S-methyltransferase